MALSSQLHGYYTRVLGVGAYLPRTRVDNAEVVASIDSTDEWIRQRSGIRSRHYAHEDETVVTMGAAAARQAVENAGKDCADIDVIIVTTVSNFNQTPAVAPQIAASIGAGDPAAFDLSAGCSGFVHGVAIAKDLITAGTAANVLVIGVERLSEMTDPHDRSTAFIFGDGAGAFLIGRSTEPAIGPVVWGSDGKNSELITQSISWTEFLRSASTHERPWFRMQGRSVFKWAVTSMTDLALNALDSAGISKNDLDVFIPHQANMRITDAVADGLNLPDHVEVARSIERMGNTSSASIPLAINSLLDSGRAESGHTALIIGFGAGLSYAATVLRLP
ncbi:beta-ketoacyl-ACP synthase III [Streptomyces sp. NPDC015492]|uniref:beta-ketoacyl-ACP synthase III n=1 Tax=Streptomyces sp. NPDC015492 TaxID=3364958 RepID=UPI0036FC89C6